MDAKARLEIRDRAEQIARFPSASDGDDVKLLVRENVPALLREIKRLREALESIQEHGEKYPDQVGSSWFFETARNALNPSA